MAERDRSRSYDIDLNPTIDSAAPAGAEAARTYYCRAIDAGRIQVAKAAAILECVTFTLAYRREATDRETQIEASDFALATEVARDLLRDSLERLETADICDSETAAKIGLGALP